MVTQSVVGRDDPAFQNPTKPVGSFLPEDIAKKMAAELGWTIAEDAGRGWRRTVPSPRPDRDRGDRRRSGNCWPPVPSSSRPAAAASRWSSKPDGTVVGLEAVVDKDLASGLLAHELGADLLMIPTGVPRVAIRFGTPDQQWLDSLTVSQARDYIDAGEFGEGSMEPKVAAIADFVEKTPHAVGVIGAAEEIAAILAGTSGTRIVGRRAGRDLRSCNRNARRCSAFRRQRHA